MSSKLAVDWREAGATWPTILEVGVGEAQADLGVSGFPDRAPIIPSALAVTDAGFAIADPAHNRVVLLDHHGKVLRVWRGLPQVMSDMVYDERNSRLVVIADESRAVIAALEEDGTVRQSRIPKNPVRLTQGPDGVGVILKESSGREAQRAVEEDLEISTVEGFPTANGDVISEKSLSQSGSRHRIVSTAGWAHIFRLYARARPRQAVSTFDSDIVWSAHRLFVGMRIGSFYPYPGEDLPLHLLELDADNGAVVSFERIATCSLVDTTNQYGFIAVRGEDIYQLCINSNSVEIRKRP